MAMASNSKTCYLPILLLLVMIIFSMAQLSIAVRDIPRTEKTVAKSTKQVTSTNDKKQTDCLEEGTVVIPGIGRYMAGTTVGPDFSGLDHSIPAATNGQFLPGIDDTIIPNPGFEIPNPFHLPTHP